MICKLYKDLTICKSILSWIPGWVNHLHRWDLVCSYSWLGREAFCKLASAIFLTLLWILVEEHVSFYKTFSRDYPTWTRRRHWLRDCQLKNIGQLGAIPRKPRVFGGWRRLPGGPKGRGHDYPCASWGQRKQKRHLRRSCRTFWPPLCTVLVETVRKTWDSVEKRP